MNHHVIEVRHTCMADPEHHYSTLIATPADRPAREALVETAARFRPWADRSPSWTVQVIYRAHLADRPADGSLRESA